MHANVVQLIAANILVVIVNLLKINAALDLLKHAW